MEPLKTAVVHRNLDRQLKLFGMEVQDLILLALLASVLNLIFGNTPIGGYMTFVPSLGLGAVLFVCKRGKPDGYLVHFLRYCFEPEFFSAGEEVNEGRRKIYEFRQ